MTRGYVVMVEGNTILSAMYHNSDSYLSYLGIIVLEEIKKGTLKNYIEAYNKENPDYAEDINGLEISWLIKDPSETSGFYVDYSYIYDVKKKTLTVYNYGELAFKLKASDFEIAEFVFKNDSKLYDKWAFDKEKLEYMRDNYKNFRAMLRRKATLDEYKALLEAKVDSFCVESGRLVDSFSSSTREYQKIITDVDTNARLYFKVKPSTFYGNAKDIYLKTPNGTMYIDKSSSDNGADAKIKKFAKENRLELINLIKLFSFIDEYEEMLSKYMFIKKNYEIAEENSLMQLNEILSRIEQFKKDNLFYRKNDTIYNLNLFKKQLEKMRQKMLTSEDPVAK